LTPEPSCKDEARVDQPDALTRVWSKRGSRPRALCDRRYQWTYIFGAICPERGVGATVVLSHVNMEAMNVHLAEISGQIRPGAHAVLVLDGAGWHDSPKLCIPDNLSLLASPPYSPELNAVENIWQFLRSNFLTHLEQLRGHSRCMLRCLE
jgi:hypothetical protein